VPAHARAPRRPEISQRFAAPADDNGCHRSGARRQILRD
jgi:hypothetical protein